MPSFDDLVREVRGYSPFPWQRRVAELLARGDFPSAIAVPTGMGKTSVIDAAVYAMAVDADRAPSERTAARRVALVVDRRLVVDGAYQHARRLADALAEAPAGSACDWVRERLVSLTALRESPLDVVRMRGGVTWAARWLRSPDQPAVVLGTVDQFGSRLLFRGYGQSDRMRPIDAALVGTDMLCFVDEAHMSDNLLVTARAVADFDRPAVAGGRSDGVRVIPMSATLREADMDDASSVVEVSDDDRDTAAAAARLTAVKRAVVVDLSGSARKQPEAAFAALADAVIDEQPESVCAVVVNTVARAREVFDRVRTSRKALVIGRCRPVDREARTDEWLPVTQAGRSRADAAGFVLVATQTIEVGVDLDVDALITEHASLDALVQRFGRVDRLGEVGDTRSYVLRATPDDPVYGDAASRTWEFLSRPASAIEITSAGEIDRVATADPAIDLGLLELRASLLGERTDLMTSSPLPTPPLSRAAVCCWRRTAPVPTPDEDVAPYLHGVGRWSPTVAVAWRFGIESGEPLPAERLLSEYPPAPAELVEVPRGALVNLLRGIPSPVADLEGVDLAGEAPAARRPPARAEHRAWVKRDGDWTAVGAADVRPGDVVVVDAAVGGHDRYGWTGPTRTPVVDVGGLIDAAGPRLRIDGGFLDALTGRSDWGEFLGDLFGADNDRAEYDDHTRDRFVEHLEHCASTSAYAELVRRAVPALRAGRWVRDEHDTDAALPARPVALAAGRAGRSVFDIDDDVPMRSSAMADESPVRLAAHLRSVGERAAAHAAQLGLPDALVEACRVAGCFHDLGKADIRFQTMLHHGRRHRGEGVAGDADLALAKSVRLPRRVEREIARRSGWVGGLRHEAMSLRLVRSAPDEWFAGADRGLVEHLVASHHGHARPLFPPVLDPGAEPIDVLFEGRSFRADAAARQHGLDHAATFDRLCERYGTWGLARLEAIVRLADMSVSEDGS